VQVRSDVSGHKRVCLHYQHHRHCTRPLSGRLRPTASLIVVVGRLEISNELHDENTVLFIFTDWRRTARSIVLQKIFFFFPFFLILILFF